MRGEQRQEDGCSRESSRKKGRRNKDSRAVTRGSLSMGPEPATRVDGNLGFSFVARERSILFYFFFIILFYFSALGPVT